MFLESVRNVSRDSGDFKMRGSPILYTPTNESDKSLKVYDSKMNDNQ